MAYISRAGPGSASSCWSCFALLGVARVGLVSLSLALLALVLRRGGTRQWHQSTGSDWGVAADADSDADVEERRHRATKTNRGIRHEPGWHSEKYRMWCMLVNTGVPMGSRGIRPCVTFLCLRYFHEEQGGVQAEWIVRLTTNCGVHGRTWNPGRREAGHSLVGRLNE